MSKLVTMSERLIYLQNKLKEIERQFNRVQQRYNQIHNYAINDKYKCFKDLDLEVQELYLKELELLKQYKTIMSKHIELYKEKYKHYLG
jgi:ribosomal protein L44E